MPAVGCAKTAGLSQVRDQLDRGQEPCRLWITQELPELEDASFIELLTRVVVGIEVDRLEWDVNGWSVHCRDSSLPGQAGASGERVIPAKREITCFQPKKVGLGNCGKRM